MIVYFVADASRNPSLWLALKRDPEAALRDYPEVSDAEAQVLLDGDPQAIRSALVADIDQMMDPGQVRVYPPTLMAEVVSFSPSRAVVGAEVAVEVGLVVTPPIRPIPETRLEMELLSPGADPVRIQGEVVGSTDQVQTVFTVAGPAILTVAGSYTIVVFYENEQARRAGVLTVTES